MAAEIFQVDTFTAPPFVGNPAAVCILDGPADVRWMQAVATEMNLSETAFIYQRTGGYSLRWFTPATEVKLCGHATLASAHVLYESGRVSGDERIRFYSASGVLTAERAGNWLTIGLPAEPPVAAELPGGVAEALGIRPVFTGWNRLDYLVVVESEQTVLGASPSFALLAKAAPERGVIATSRTARPGYDYICRYFDPAEGINEDPVTGSAHCCLGPYWQSVIGKDAFTAYQASPRGGTIKVVVTGPRVMLSGQVVTVLRGELLA